MQDLPVKISPKAQSRKQPRACSYTEHFEVEGHYAVVDDLNQIILGMLPQTAPLGYR